MDWLSNMIESLWDWVLGIWGSGLSSIQLWLTTSPSEFGGGQIWNVVEDMQGSLQGIGYTLLVLFFYIGLTKSTLSFYELRRPEISFSLFIRFFIIKTLIDSGTGILLLLIKTSQRVVSAVFSASSLTNSIVTLPDDIRIGIRQAAFLEKLIFLLISILAVAVIITMVFTVILTVFGRFFKIFACAAFAPIPFSTMAGEPTQRMGFDYLKLFASLCLEGAVIAIACVLYSAFVQFMPDFTIGAASGLLAKLLGYIVSVVLHTLLLSGFIKSADYLLNRFMH